MTLAEHLQPARSCIREIDPTRGSGGCGRLQRNVDAWTHEKVSSCSGGRQA
jgi:hypothetical protein